MVVTAILPVMVMAAEQPAMAVTVPVTAMQFAPCGDTDPAAEGNESNAGSGIDPVAEPSGEGGTGSPNDQPDNEGGGDVAGSC